jgi:hypothetical protein
MCFLVLYIFSTTSNKVHCSFVFIMSCKSTIPIIVSLFCGPNPVYRIFICLVELSIYTNSLVIKLLWRIFLWLIWCIEFDSLDRSWRLFILWRHSQDVNLYYHLFSSLHFLKWNVIAYTLHLRRMLMDGISYFPPCQISSISTLSKYIYI